MKKIITTVGASLFSNYNEENSTAINHWKVIEDRPHSAWDNERERIERVRKTVLSWALKRETASAEILSNIRLQKELGEDIELYLISTDTVASRLAAEIIGQVFCDRDGVNVFFNPQFDVIGGLQVYQYDDFVRRGLPGLVNRIHNIAGGFFENVIFNIAGGYKGIIPYMTIMAQVNGCDIVYLFEKSEQVMRIPRTPILIDYAIFERYNEHIAMLDNGIENYPQAKSKELQVFEELENKGLVEQADGMACLSPLGEIFLKRFNTERFVFYCSDEVWNQINKQQDISRILTEKFHNKLLRENKTELKPEQTKHHRVYDDGNNNNRIFFFEENGRLFIYKTFEKEEEQLAYLPTPLDRVKIISGAKKRIWRLR